MDLRRRLSAQRARSRHGAMLLGRLLQGCGGLMVALSHVGVIQLFPRARWPGLLAVISAVWGISALLGPLIGGAFATAGLWRGAFRAFAAQAVVLAAAVPLLLGSRADAALPPGEAVPWRRVLVLGAGVGAVLLAGVQADHGRALACIALGLALLAGALRLERRPSPRLLPRHPLDLRRPWGGAGYVMVLALSTATVSFTVYGPLLMETLFGAPPLLAGLMIALESIAWTLAAILVARAGTRREPALIRGGALAITLGIIGFAWRMPFGPVAALVPWAILLGAGFGACWAFGMRRVVESVPGGERERAAASLPPRRAPWSSSRGSGGSPRSCRSPRSGWSPPGDSRQAGGRPMSVVVASAQRSRNAIGLPSRSMINLPPSSCTAM